MVANVNASKTLKARNDPDVEDPKALTGTKKKGQVGVFYHELVRRAKTAEWLQHGVSSPTDGPPAGVFSPV